MKNLAQNLVCRKQPWLPLQFSSGPEKKDDDSLSSKKPEFDVCSKERTDDVRVGTKKGNNSSRINQDVSTDLFLSPSTGALNKSDMYFMSNMLKNSQGRGDTIKPRGFSHEGNQYEDGDIFYRKRHKLRQCVVDTLFPDTEKPCSKGNETKDRKLDIAYETKVISTPGSTCATHSLGS